MEFIYDTKSKEKCWYKPICTVEKCDEETYCIRHHKMSFLVNASTMEGNQQYSSLLRPENVDKEAFLRLKDIKDNIVNFVKEGRDLLIYSKNTGNGKTSWAKKLMLSWFNGIWASSDFECRGLFISLPKFIFAMKENIQKPNEYFEYVNENIKSADLVVWDDINYKDWTPFELDYLLGVIDQRVSVGKANIYTSNYDLETISNKLGTRLASRIVGCSECIEFKGKDRRGMNE